MTANDLLKCVTERCRMFSSRIVTHRELCSLEGRQSREFMAYIRHDLAQSMCQGLETKATFTREEFPRDASSQFTASVFVLSEGEMLDALRRAYDEGTRAVLPNPSKAPYWGY